MASVTIYGFAASTYVRSARMTCIEKNVPHALEGFGFRSPEHARLHPFLKMPAARLGEFQLFETIAIVTAIDDMFEGASLQPKGVEDRARMLQWMSAGVDYVFDDLVRAHLGDGEADPEVVSRIGRALVLIDTALAKEGFLAGGSLSLADLFLYPMVAFAESQVAGFDDLMKDQANVIGWMDRLAERASARDTLSEGRRR